MTMLGLDDRTDDVFLGTYQRMDDFPGSLGRKSPVATERNHQKPGLGSRQRVNQIIVLHKGELREMGDHQALLAQRGLYHRLYQLQYKELKAASHSAASD